jgi:hypothetical protein
VRRWLIDAAGERASDHIRFSLFGTLEKEQLAQRVSDK